MVNFHKHARVLLMVSFVLMSVSSVCAQLPSQDPGSKQKTAIDGVKFSVPRNFNLEASSDPRVAFMRHEKYDLALFVALPNKTDDNYLTALSNTLVSQLFPTEKEFRWKLSPLDEDGKVSRFQTVSGSTKGFNNKRAFQTHFIAIKVDGREILVGYIIQIGQWNNDAKALFEREEESGMSMPGWYAQAHTIASITGEKYKEINPGTVIKGSPVP